jgi:S-adenosylmethionine:tRNA ribosyltransferase-isomerase
VFNNTSVIKARILFRKTTGAAIEVLCIEPIAPLDYMSAFISGTPVVWKCIVGNLKKWKNGSVSKPFMYNGKQYELKAEKLHQYNDAWSIRFSWNCNEINFGEVIDIVGHVPLPPYINREDGEEDTKRYQTVYSCYKGSVAAPTAGLHFTKMNLDRLQVKGIKRADLTLHVGAGTFQPIKTENITDHQMHNEHFFVSDKTVKMLIENLGNVIPVGTTSVRTIESLYWLGVKTLTADQVFESDLKLEQWEPYRMKATINPAEALESLLELMKKRNTTSIDASTSIIIVPGYNFKIINGMITNFHQPRSTLLLLISAWVGQDWKNIYSFALDRKFRFLSYGDCSLLLK